jgi:hypothetical protein
LARLRGGRRLGSTFLPFSRYLSLGA